MVVAIRLLLIGLLTFESIFQYFRPQNIHLIIIGVIPALLWLTFFLLEEKRKKYEPKRTIVYLFIMGIFAALTAFDAQTLIKNGLFAPFGIAGPSLIGITTFAFIEEFLKFLFVYIGIRKSKYFDEPIDCMLDMITGAMGFAAFENILFIISSGDGIAKVAVFRFIGAILLHAIASGFIGFYWSRRKILVGLMIATSIHSLFNAIVLHSENGIFFAPFFLVFLSFFLFRDFDIIKNANKNNHE